MEANYKMVEIDPSAQIAHDVEIGSFSCIAGDVVIGEGTWIGPHVTILDGVRIGKNCKIHPGTVLGGIPQDLKFKNEYSLLEIGDNVTVREYCTLNRGTIDKGTTKIDDNCLIMAYVHIAHDCTIGKNSILANSVNLAGHIEVGSHVVIGGMSAVHQFVKIGDHAMVGGGSLVRKDVPPFVKAAREPLSYAGVNSIGLKRRGFSQEEVNRIQDVYRYLFVKGYNTKQALELIKDNVSDHPHKTQILDFIAGSTRGLMKGLRQANQG